MHNIIYIIFNFIIILYKYFFIIIIVKNYEFRVYNYQLY